MEGTYNGWKNRQTWNVMLWISNDYSLYMAACDYVRENPNRTKGLYKGFIDSMGLSDERTPDGVAWLSKSLDHKELNLAMRELID